MKELKDKVIAEIKRIGVTGDRDAMERIREYVTAYENGTPLNVEGTAGKYRVISEYGGFVLAGYKYQGDGAGRGYQFATWQYTNGRTGVMHGHYYPTWGFGIDALTVAKEDFSVRSGLVNGNKIFRPEQLAEMHRAMGFHLRGNPEITLKQEEKIKQCMSQIEWLMPEPYPEPAPQEGLDMNL